ncbi:hypothetical protein I302_104068 [Kwoniella bestiolae CBS 10118]|uniref:RRM domain-containing protein n=1 Tax=Kwoniella bestiolae CBS 10118 TaxID=1296100 RepID=A0A1B9GA77_9TREE|nr:hypothetical protein I302_02773 [Kwoniella bestiolae CBS 10118]OCF27923.1 hypothetical protein I302_02773 [Kwoniella bestiolae CBS 10118]
MSDTITKRLYVGGITPAITTTHIKERFSSFGVVSNIEELGPDALGQPRPFTFLTISTTPAQLKKCLNILSGSFWRGTQLKLSEAKPNYTTRYPLPQPTPEERRKTLEKKRKRVESKRGEDTGKLAQDIRLVTPYIAEKKKFWVVGVDGRMIRPLALRPSHPMGRPLVEDVRNKVEGNDKKRIRGPPERLRRRVINPVAWGSIYVTGDRLVSTLEERVEGQHEERGEWEYEELSEDEIEEAEDEDGRSVIGVWKRRNQDGKVVEESVVKGKKRRVSVEEDEDRMLGGGEVDEGSPLFGTRDLQDREESPLFPSRGDDVEEEKSSTAKEGEGESSPLFPTRDERAKSTSPLFPARHDENHTNQPSSPLFPTRDIAHKSAEGNQEDPSSPLFPTRPTEPEFIPSDDNESVDAQQQRQQSNSPLFPTRSLPPQPESESKSPTPPPTVQPQLKARTQPIPSLPSQILASARAERSSALGVLGSLLGDLSPPAKQEKVVWDVYPESDEDEEVEFGRGGSESAVSEIPALAGQGKGEDVVVGLAKEPEMDIPVDAEPVDGDSSSGSNDSSGSSSEDGEDGMDVDPPAGNGGKESSSGSGSGSSSSGSGSGSGDDDDSSDSSSDSGSDSEDTSEEEDSESDSEEEEEEEKDKSTVHPKPGLRDMFAPTTSSAFNFASTSAAPSGGFSLLANLGEDIELDEDMDIPLPFPSVDVETQQNQEEELAPLPLNQSSGRGKIKFDPSSSDIPLFFTLPSEAGSGTRKGESRNLYDELHSGIPTTTINEYGEEEEGENVVLPGFSRQVGENDESMKSKWENEKLELTQGWKKRFREARKSKRRKGGEEVE